MVVRRYKLQIYPKILQIRVTLDLAMEKKLRSLIACNRAHLQEGHLLSLLMKVIVFKSVLLMLEGKSSITLLLLSKSQSHEDLSICYKYDKDWLDLIV